MHANSPSKTGANVQGAARGDSALSNSGAQLELRTRWNQMPLIGRQLIRNRAIQQ